VLEQVPGVAYESKGGCSFAYNADTLSALWFSWGIVLQLITTCFHL
jgi:hypothetical protein